MDSKMQLQKNAAVLAADGQRIGSLNRVVVNPSTLALTDIVVRTDNLMDHDERVIPVKWVAKTVADQVILGVQKVDLETFPLFNEEQSVDTEKMQNMLLEKSQGTCSMVSQCLGYRDSLQSMKNL